MSIYHRAGFFLSFNTILFRDTDTVQILSPSACISDSKISNKVFQDNSFFLNIRDEMTIFINGYPYVLRKPHSSIPHEEDIKYIDDNRASLNKNISFPCENLFISDSFAEDNDKTYATKMVNCENEKKIYSRNILNESNKEFDRNDMSPTHENNKKTFGEDELYGKGKLEKIKQVLIKDIKNKIESNNKDKLELNTINSKKAQSYEDVSKKSNVDQGFNTNQENKKDFEKGIGKLSITNVRKCKSDNFLNKKINEIGTNTTQENFSGSFNYAEKTRENLFDDSLIKEIVGSSGNILEINEEKLKVEILDEYKQNGFLRVIQGKSIVDIKEISVKTSKEYINSLNKTLKYVHIPFSVYGIGIENRSMDIFLKILSKSIESNPYLNFYSDELKERNFFCIYIYLIFKFIICGDEKKCMYEKKNFEKFKNITNTYDGKNIKHLVEHCLKGNFKIVNNLCTILEYKNSKTLVDKIMVHDYNFKLYILDIIFCKNKDISFLSNIYLSRYIVLILLAEYLYLHKKSGKDFLNGFIKFIRSHFEYKNMFSYIRSKQKSFDLLAPLDVIFSDRDIAVIKPIKNINGILVKTKKNEKNNKQPKVELEKEALYKSKIKIVTDLFKKKHLEKYSFFINVREEPLIVINKSLYTIRNKERYGKNITFLRDTNESKISNIEERLKESILEDIHKKGKTAYYIVSKNALEEKYIGFRETEVMFLKDYIELHSHDTDYFRVPITSSLPFKFSVFDQIIEVVNKIKNKIIEQEKLLKNKKTRDYRKLEVIPGIGEHMFQISDEKVASNQANINDSINFSENNASFMCLDKITIHSNTHKGRGAYTAMIIEILLNKDNLYDLKCTGLDIKIINLLLTVLDSGKRAYNIVNYMFIKYIESGIEEFIFSSKNLKIAKRTVEKYILMICFTSWALKNSQNNESFENWISGRKDILNILKKISSIQLSDLQEDITITDNDYILGHKMILKNDYFVGSQFFQLGEQIKGTQNFRYVKSGESSLIIGLSIPTEKGISNTIKKINEINLTKSPIYWFCMREEPVIYINKEPYVLRHIGNQNENLEITGISADILENIESKLLKKILKQESISLYDEILVSNNIETTIRKININTVNTTKEIYSKFDIYYRRVPVTDEKAPLPIIIDQMHFELNKMENHKVIVFNCQMGKGRTTTAMILTYIYLNYNNANLINKFKKPKYKMIFLLCQILPNFEKSKSIADEVIDLMAHLENLRDIVNVCAERNLISKGKNFLMRYFYIICFCEYLIDENRVNKIEFSIWLKNRREIQNLAKMIDIIGLEEV